MSFVDRPKSITFASAKARASTTKLQSIIPSTGSTSRTMRTASTGNTAIRPSAGSTKRMKRAVSTGNSSLSIHQNPYNKSIAQQEEGRRRRQGIELRFWQGMLDAINSVWKKKLRNRNCEIIIVQAKLLYVRLISHKARVGDRKVTLRHQNEERGMQ